MEITHRETTNFNINFDGQVMLQNDSHEKTEPTPDRGLPRLTSRGELEKLITANMSGNEILKDHNGQCYFVMTGPNGEPVKVIVPCPE